MDSIISLLIFLSLGYFFGTFFEKNHYRSVIQREKVYMFYPAVTIEKKITQDENNIKKVKLVYGSVVISSDFFKDFVAGLKNLFGGRLNTYESLMDRARREATLRMKQMAPDADIIINFRTETSQIGGRRRKRNGYCVEVLAYGTAIYYDN